MADHDDEHRALEHALDAILEPAWTRELRRAWIRRIARGVLGMVLLLGAVAALTSALRTAVVLPEMLFFTGIGAFAFFGPGSKAYPGRPARPAPPRRRPTGLAEG